MTPQSFTAPTANRLLVIQNRPWHEPIPMSVMCKVTCKSRSHEKPWLGLPTPKYKKNRRALTSTLERVENIIRHLVVFDARQLEPNEGLLDVVHGDGIAIVTFNLKWGKVGILTAQKKYSYPVKLTIIPRKNLGMFPHKSSIRRLVAIRRFFPPNYLVPRHVSMCTKEKSRYFV